MLRCSVHVIVEEFSQRRGNRAHSLVEVFHAELEVVLVALVSIIL